MAVIEWERAAPSELPRTGHMRAGAAKVDITPALGGFTAGWGPNLAPRKALRCVSRLFARVLVLDDGHGERVAFITADLHSGTRYLTERIALLTAAQGFHVGRVVLVGAHTHSAPGNLYATAYYDAFCTSFPWVVGFDRELADAMSERIAGAVREACAALKPARVGHGVSRLWTWTANRSLDAAMANFAGEAHDLLRARLQKRYAAEPELISFERLLVDPRLQVLAAFGEDGAVIGAFSTFAGHNSLLAREHDTLGGDWFGFAQDLAEQASTPESGVRPVIGLGAGAMGDVDPRPPGVSLSDLLARRQRSLTENLTLMRDHGARLAHALVDALDEAQKAPALERITVRFAEPRVGGVTLDDGAVMPLEPCVGASTLAGSELGPGVLTEGLRDDDVDNATDAHWPKVHDDFAMRVIQPALDALHVQPMTLPLRLIEVGGVTVLGLPGEPTTWLAAGLEDLLLESGAKAVMPAATCGDYAGYFTTEREYEQQHYEGASTLWGRFTERWLKQQVKSLVKSAGTPAGRAHFTTEPFTGPQLRVDVQVVPVAPHRAPVLEKVPEGRRLSGAFRWRREATPPLWAWGAWLRVTSAGQPVQCEPEVWLDEPSQVLWWHATLGDDAVGALEVTLAHPLGAGVWTLD